MENADRFENLYVWKKARELSTEIFLKTEVAPFSRDFGLANQINRATGSIIDNIAEGFERNGNGEYAYFLTVAKGSAGECDET